MDGPANLVWCPLLGRGNKLAVVRAADQVTVETFEMFVIAAGETRSLMYQSRTRHMLLQIFDCLFPSWRARRTWITKALARARQHPGRSLTQIDGLNIIVQHHMYADVEGDFGLIVVTKRQDLDELVPRQDDD
jgi:hypothetical protein